MIKLGTKVKDKVSGFVGIVVSRTEYMNGCVRYAVQAKVKKDHTIPNLEHFDEFDIIEGAVLDGGDFSKTGGPAHNPVGPQTPK